MRKNSESQRPLAPVWPNQKARQRNRRVPLATNVAVFTFQCTKLDST